MVEWGERVQLTWRAVQQWNREAEAEGRSGAYEDLVYGVNQGIVCGQSDGEWVVSWDLPGLAGESQTTHNGEDLELVAE